MFCPNCGTPNPDDSYFCSSCGVRIKIDPGIAEGTASVDPSTEKAYAGYTSYAAEAQRPRSAASSANADSNRNWAAVTGFVMGIVSLMVFPLSVLLSVPGLVFSIIGVKSAQKGLSIAGIVLSALAIAVAVLLVALIIFAVVGSAAYGNYDFYNEFGDVFNSLRMMLPYLAH